MAFKEKTAAFRYINEYQKEKYERITILVKRGTKDGYRQAASDLGMSVSEFFVYCAERVMEWQDKEKKD